MSHIVVGVDAGASRIRVQIARDGVLIAHGDAPSVNPNVTGASLSIGSIVRLIRDLLGENTADAICVGAAGIDRDVIRKAYETGLRESFSPQKLLVVPDALVALRAAVPDGDAAVLVAGTGSIAFAVNGAETYRCGGYGHAFGDEGGGFEIGRQGVRLALRALDGRGTRDEFIDAVCEMTNAYDLRELLAWVYNDASPSRNLAQVAPLVLRFASQGHRPTAKIVQQAALDLSELARAIVHKAGLAEREVPLVFAGGLLRSNSIFTFLLETRITNELPLMRIMKAGPEPVTGALALAEASLR